ncbi:MAG: hypothetical protein ABL916_24355 [Burkholderiaceae bacterium]
MTNPQPPQGSALKEARLLRKLGKRLGIPGAGLPRIIATIQTLKAAADEAAARKASSAAPTLQPIAVRGDMTLAELLSVVDGLQPVAGSIAAWHKPEPVELTAPMRALRAG